MEFRDGVFGGVGGANFEVGDEGLGDPSKRAKNLVGDVIVNLGDWGCSGTEFKVDVEKRERKMG